MASKILPHLPPHTDYCEPYAGGAALLFKKPRREVTNTHHYREVLNDLRGDVVALYRIATQEPDALRARLESTLYSREEFQRAREVSRDPDASDLDRAWACYVGANQAFANHLYRGWAFGTTSCNLAAKWENKLAALKSQLERLRGVNIDNRDALECIEKWDAPHTVFYCDPPYPGTDQGHYGGKTKAAFTQDDFQALVDKALASEGSFVISSYNQNPPPGFELVTFEAHCTANGQGKTRKQGRTSRAAKSTTTQPEKRKRTECLWILDRSANIRSDLKKVLAKYDDRVLA